MAQGHLNPEPKNLASLFRGLYDRVASHLNVDPSYVSRVARGERPSEEIELALDRETRQIMKMLKFNHNGSGRHAAKHNGASRNGVGHNPNKKTRLVKT